MIYIIDWEQTCRKHYLLLRILKSCLLKLVFYDLGISQNLNLLGGTFKRCGNRRKAV